MIRRLRGTVVERSTTALVVDVGGVGYGVSVTSRHYAALDAPIELVVYTQVRDDAIQLYGFPSAPERELFELLLVVPGIGPAKAMAILEADPRELVALVLKKDAVRLAKLPGIGKKTAERLVLDLADKVAAIGLDVGAAATTPSRRPAPASTTREDLLSALQNLGFRPAQAEAAVDKVMERAPDGAAVDVLLREALQVLTQRAAP
jgi:Holliday junction DNA helicase RuvA